MSSVWEPTYPANPQPYRVYWLFDHVAYNAIWATVQVPADLSTGTNLSIYIWTERVGGSLTGTMRWGFDAWVGTRAGLGVGSVLANQTGAASVIYPTRYSEFVDPYSGFVWSQLPAPNWYAQRSLLGAFAVTAGDIVHAEIYRDPTHVDDTCGYDGQLFVVEFSYTADN